eukprot:gene2510-2815_t
MLLPLTGPPLVLLQAALPAGCDLNQALQLLQAAGLWVALEQQRPLLAKPAFTATGAGAGHTLGAVLTMEGLQQLLQGAVEDLQLPVVLQEFVPHGPALYKAYATALVVWVL